MTGVRKNSLENQGSIGRFKINSSLVLKLAVSSGALGFLLWWLPLDLILNTLGKVSLIQWCIAIVLFLIGHIIAAQKWRVLLRQVGVTGSAYQVIRAHAAGLFANLCLPSIVGGDVVRASIISENRESIARVAVASLADRLIDTIGLLLLTVAAWAIFRHYDSATAAMGGGLYEYAILAIAALLLLAVLTLVAIIYIIKDDWIPAKVRKTVQKLRVSTDHLVKAPQLTLMVLFLSIGIQSSFILVNIHLANSMGLLVDTAVWFMVWPLAKLFALLPVSLGGIGVRDVALVGLLLPFGYESALVASQSFSWQVVLIAGGLMSGVFALFSKTKN